MSFPKPSKLQIVPFSQNGTSQNAISQNAIPIIIKRDPVLTAKSYLTDYQKEIVEECLKLKTGGLSIPMGSGKTVISLIVALTLTQHTQNTILVVCSKSLISSWISEIHKFFDDTLSYEVYHSDFVGNKKQKDVWIPTAKVILTNPETISNIFRLNNLREHFVIREDGFPPTTYYLPPSTPYLTHTMGGGLLYSIKFGCLLIDEIQNYLSLYCNRSCSLGGLCADYRWGLSGTIITEPKIEKILGYYAILNIPKTPRDVTDLRNYIRDSDFKGITSSMVVRTTNPMLNLDVIKIKEVVLSHVLSYEEAQLYLLIKETLTYINQQAQQFFLAEDVENGRRFASFLMSIVLYLRETLICPMIPLASIAINMADCRERSQLSVLLTDKMKEIGLHSYLNNPENIKSSRIKKVIEACGTHNKEKIVIFTSFRTSVDVLKYCLTGRPIFDISANLPMQKRGEVIDNFRNSTNGILLLTYDIGSCGLNLQCASVVILVDYLWNSAITKQAIARVLRYGQKSEEITIYFLTSNTGIEKAMLEKHKLKNEIIDELKFGVVTKNMKSMPMKDIVRIIENADENAELLRQTNFLNMRK